MFPFWSLWQHNKKTFISQRMDAISQTVQNNTQLQQFDVICWCTFTKIHFMCMKRCRWCVVHLTIRAKPPTVIVADSLTYFVKYFLGRTAPMSQTVLHLNISMGWWTDAYIKKPYFTTPGITLTNICFKRKKNFAVHDSCVYRCMSVTCIYLLVTVLFVSNWACVDELYWVMLHWSLLINTEQVIHRSVYYLGV